MGVLDKTVVIKAIFYSFAQIWIYRKTYLIIFAVINIIMGLIPVAMVWTTQRLVDSVSDIFFKGSSIKDGIVYFSIEVFLLALSFSIDHLTTLNDQKNKNVLGKITYSNLLAKIKRFPFILFETPDIHNKINRIAGNRSVFTTITNDFLSLTKNVISISSILVYLIHIHWLFILILLIGIIPLVSIQLLYGYKNYNLNVQLTPFGRKENYISTLLTNRDSLKEIKLYSLIDPLQKRWEEYYDKNVESQYLLIKKRTLWTFLAELFVTLTYAGSGLFLFYLIYKGNLYLGQFVAVLGSVQNIQTSLEASSINISGIYEKSLFVNEYKEFMHSPELEQDHLKEEIKKINTLSLRNVSFQYPNKSDPTIKNIDLEIPIGKHITIIGENGSGKTTLTKCIAGLYEVNSGEILVNDIDFRKIDISLYQKRVSVLFQDYIKYMFNVRENIGFGDYLHINDLTKIIEAATATNIHTEINRMSTGYETELGNMFENGSQLSGGQWQKLALSRALFRNSDLIILDEPTSSLDPISEVNVLEKLYKNASGKSIICITHRVGPSLLSDEIIVMKEGNIVEKGSHNELMELKGHYYNLYKTQEKWYRRKEEINI